MPDIFYDKQESIPEGLREFAKAGEDGKFVINVVPKVKLDEFRTTNVNLVKERDELLAYKTTVAPLVGDDLEGFKTGLEGLRATDQQVKDGTLKTSAAIETELEKRTKAMREDHQRALLAEANKRAEAEKTAGVADGKYRRSLVDRAVTDAVLSEKSGAEQSALPDILNRAYGIFQVGDDGKLTAKDGDAIVYGSDGATPMTPGEWLGQLKDKAPHFFKSSTGGGANGSGATGKDSIGGMSRADFNKLPARTRLKVANEKQAGK